MDELLYTASFNLDWGESAMSAAVSESEAAHIDHSDRPDAPSYIQMADDGTSTVDPQGARLLFCNDCPVALPTRPWPASGAIP